VFKLGTGNDLGISYNWYGFAVERLRLGLGLTAKRFEFEVYECFLVNIIIVIIIKIINVTDRNAQILGKKSLH